MFEIGDSLREARQRRSIAYGQAELATKIRAKYLRALEDEHFDQLPSPTYVKGFLQAYADFLGLDGQLYVDEYNSRFVAGDDWDGPRRSRVRPDQRERGVETSIVVVALVLIAIVTVVVISAWQVSGSPPKQTTPPKHKAAAPVVRPPSAFLEIEALSGPSYVEVHRGGPGGRILFAGTVEKGHLEPFQGTAFWVSVSSPENLALIVAGRRVALSGAKPEALSVSRDGVRPV
jgi:hypothetical protein